MRGVVAKTIIAMNFRKMFFMRNVIMELIYVAKIVLPSLLKQTNSEKKHGQNTYKTSTIPSKMPSGGICGAMGAGCFLSATS